MRKALFLDRDGVINKEINYLHTIEKFEFIPEIFDICRFYSQNRFLIFVVTNQAGIARGYYSVDDVFKLNEWMVAQFQAQGIPIEKIYFCPHHPDITGPCSCRKPNPGMILTAAKEFEINLSKSILIGDKESDIEAGYNAGIFNCFHIDEIIHSINNLPLPK
jgi:D-glycero-D-manno-heptose 1,7-bisphosphate phosphatase